VTRPAFLFAAWLAFGVACLALGLWLRAYGAPEWMAPDTTQHPPALRPWMVEDDCYSQMARVQRILRGQGLVQNHFTVENWPEGLVPSTTAPFDYCIVLLYAPLKLFTADPLDWAGALVSPLLWVALVLFWMFFRSREFTRAGRALFLLGSAALPGFIWATACGRPRHQSLILVLIALGLVAEYERWHLAAVPRKAWSLFAGIVWGLACWTSLFEPTIVLSVVLLFNAVSRRRETAVFLGSFAAVVALSFLVEGPHTLIASALLLHPAAEYAAPLHNWLATVSEIQGTTLSIPQFGHEIARMISLLLLPWIGWLLWTRENLNRTDRLLVVLNFLLLLFSIGQGRWTYYANLAELFLVVRFYQLAPARGPQLAVLAVFLLGLLNVNYFEFKARAQASPNQPSLQLLQVANAIDAPGGILGPWWLSPGLLYFSGQPIVTGSSHCGISGIVAGAQFYAATSWVDAERILRARKVRWVVVSDDPDYEYPLLNISRRILGRPVYTDDDAAAADRSIAQILINDRFVPTWLQLRAVTSQLKLYEYTPAGAAP
jgi:hypothetical protein